MAALRRKPRIPPREGLEEKEIATATVENPPEPAPEPLFPSEVTDVMASCQGYWASNGSAKELQKVRTTIQNSGIKKNELKWCRDMLPVQAHGTTGGKVRNLEGMITRYLGDG